MKTKNQPPDRKFAKPGCPFDWLQRRLGELHALDCVVRNVRSEGVAVSVHRAGSSGAFGPSLFVRRSLHPDLAIKLDPSANRRRPV